MDSLFPKMLAEIETNVDIVFVIDVTKSMERMIDIIQTAAISFLDEFFEKMNSMKRRVENLRVKVISFRDFYYDGNHAYNESKFFTMPNEKMDLKEYLNEIYADGGGDDPESGLEALAMAMKSDFLVYIKSCCHMCSHRQQLSTRSVSLVLSSFLSPPISV